MVPAASAEVPETLVTGALEQIGPFTIGAKATLLIIEVTEPVETHLLGAMAITDNV